MIKVILGSTDISDVDTGAQQFMITNQADMIIHENYDRGNLNNDLAVIKLPSAIQFNSKIQMIALPRRSSNPPSYVNVISTASGWGKTKDSDESVTNQLRFVKLQVISNRECSRHYAQGLIVSTTLCTSTRGKKSTCSGDSGGPLTDGKELIGVTSFVSQKGCEKQTPAGFSRVTSYLQWIKDNTGLNV